MAFLIVFEASTSSGTDSPKPSDWPPAPWPMRVPSVREHGMASVSRSTDDRDAGTRRHGDLRRPLMTRVRLSVLAIVPILVASIGAQSPAAPPALDQLVERVRTTFDVPGISLAIVKDDRVVVARGYGVRELGQAAAVDGRTLFGIASNTKVFTATALGLLVEEGKVAWDAPVARYLPWFPLSDPYVKRELPVRDLLVHRSGLGLG